MHDVAIPDDVLLALEPHLAVWAATIILSGGTTNMMAGGEESKAA
jgi:hypothetical protein